MSKLYLPNSVDINNKVCLTFNNNSNNPSVNIYYSNGGQYSYRYQTINYNFMLNDYLISDFNLTNNLPLNCNNNVELTHEEFYRVDYKDSIISFTIFFFFVIVIPLFIIFKFFKRRFL